MQPGQTGKLLENNLRLRAGRKLVELVLSGKIGCLPGLLNRTGKAFLAWTRRHPRLGSLLVLLPVLLVLFGFGPEPPAYAAGSLYQIAPCAPPSDQNLNFDGNPGMDFDLGKWAGWLLGKICQWVAVVFFQVANHILGWGSGCNNIQLNFVTDTPWEYIANQSQPAFGDLLRNGLVWSIISFQFFWLALNLFWRRQQVTMEDLLVRTLLGTALSGLSFEIARWFLQICQALSQALNSGGNLRLFDGVLQLDSNGNIFNTLLSMFAALVAVLFVLQMAIRLIYIGFLLYLLPLGGALWLNPGTQYYARMLYGNFFATVFIQPLQLGVVAVTAMFVKGARAYADTSLAMLFGICGLFLALGLPRTFNSALGGSTPIGPVGLVLAGRLALGNLRQAGRALGNGGGGHAGASSGNRGGGGGGGRISIGGRHPWGGGGFQPLPAGWGSPGSLRYGGTGGPNPFRSNRGWPSTGQAQSVAANPAPVTTGSSGSAATATTPDSGTGWASNPSSGSVTTSTSPAYNPASSPGYSPAPDAVTSQTGNPGEDIAWRPGQTFINPTPVIPGLAGESGGSGGSAIMPPATRGNPTGTPPNPPVKAAPPVLDLGPHRPRPGRKNRPEGGGVSE